MTDLYKTDYLSLKTQGEASYRAALVTNGSCCKQFLTLNLHCWPSEDRPFNIFNIVIIFSGLLSSWCVIWGFGGFSPPPQ